MGVEVDPTPIEADVLVVGGGIAGLMAGIRAAELGAETVIADKANPLRSGSGATGNDHFRCYIPEVHGEDIKPIIEEHLASQAGGWWQDLDLIYTFYRNSFEMVRRWESYGIPMRPHGCWEFTGHAFPNRPRICLKYAGAEQKPILVRVARERGVRILSRTPIIDLIAKNGRVVGAIGLDASRDDPLVKIFRVKGVVLCTGCVTRLYPSITPGWLFNTAYCPANTGSGVAMAYRCGAKLINMEVPYTHAGPKYFERCGKATWIGVLTDFFGNRISPWVVKPSRELGDIAADIWRDVFDYMMQSGKSPVYMDCSEASDEDLEYMIWGLRNEGNTALLDYLREEGLDLKRYRYEFTRYEPMLCGRGVEINVKGETSVEGLYAAGDVVGNLTAYTPGAAVFGWIAGGSAAEYAKRVSFERVEESPLIKERVGFCSSLMSRNRGASWKEFNLALQQIMNDYVGLRARSATLLRAALTYLGNLRRAACKSVRVENSHELMRALEVFDLLEVGEVVALAILQRDETRPPHIRLDCPWTNPLYNNLLLTVRKVGDRPVFEWRRRREEVS